MIAEVSEPDDNADDFVLDTALVLGVWANGTNVLLRRDEITIDFLRDVPELPRALLVARALVPRRVAFDLRDQLDEILRSYTDHSMPEDIG